MVVVSFRTFSERASRSPIFSTMSMRSAVVAHRCSSTLPTALTSVPTSNRSSPASTSSSTFLLRGEGVLISSGLRGGKMKMGVCCRRAQTQVMTAVPSSTVKRDGQRERFAPRRPSYVPW